MALAVLAFANKHFTSGGSRIFLLGMISSEGVLNYQFREGNECLNFGLDIFYIQQFRKSETYFTCFLW